jgi:hypothetical protein
MTPLDLFVIIFGIFAMVAGIAALIMLYFWPKGHDAALLPAGWATGGTRSLRTQRAGESKR